MKKPTLADRMKSPALPSEVERQRARLDAEGWDWVVLEPKHYRALLAVVRASDRCETRRAVYVITGDPKHHRAWMLAIERWHRARARLEKVSKGGKP